MAHLRVQQFSSAAKAVRLSNVEGVPAWQGIEASATAGGIENAGPNSSSRQLHLLPGLLDAREVDKVLTAARANERGFDLTHDTVDKEATYLCRVVDDGEVVDAAVGAALSPFLYERLLPYVRQKFGCATACVQNVLIRRYLPEERRRLEAHFDVSSFATAIVPLSPPADYAGGLYVQHVPGVTSRHYLALDAGDCLVHQFDTMHGVHVPRGSRFSLVVWFTDSEEALHSGKAPWVERAAAAGNAEAQFVLAGFIYRGELGYAADTPTAVRWLAKAARAGNALAMLHVGSMLASGEVPEDALPELRADHGVDALASPLQLAAVLYRAAAEQGHPTAEYAYGAALLKGEGVAKDVGRGRHWLTKAASQGEEEVMAAGWAMDELRAYDASLVAM